MALYQLKYSHYALRSILVENGITIPELESILYEFVGKKAIVSQKELALCVKDSGLTEHKVQDVVEFRQPARGERRGVRAGGQ